MSTYTGVIDQYKDRDTCYHTWLHYPCIEDVKAKRVFQAMRRWLRSRGFKGGSLNGYR